MYLELKVIVLYCHYRLLMTGPTTKQTKENPFGVGIKLNSSMNGYIIKDTIRRMC